VRDTTFKEQSSLSENYYPIQLNHVRVCIRLIVTLMARCHKK